MPHCAADFARPDNFGKQDGIKQKKGRPTDLPINVIRPTTTCPQMIQSTFCVRGGDGKRVRGDRWR